MENNKLQYCICLQINGKGKVTYSLEGLRSMINFWALQNTNGKKTTYIADKETGKVIRIYKGNGDNSLPTIIKEDKVPDDLYIMQGE